MKNLITNLLLVIALLTITAIPSFAQGSNDEVLGGIQINALLPATEFKYDQGLKASYLTRGLVRFPISNMMQGEIGFGYGRLAGFDFDKHYWGTNIIPIDFRFLVEPFGSNVPYLYAGAGVMHYGVKFFPISVSPKSVESKGWTGIIPIGIGKVFKLTDVISIDLNAGATYSFTDNLNYYRLGSPTDAYYQIGIGFLFGSDENTDKDNDGLTKKQEKALGTNPNNADTDGDGLKDGEEVNRYKTNPLNQDSDNDGLKDGEEITKYNTDPMNFDTDKDGLKDGEEVNKHKTEPLDPDTDADGLKDGEEAITYKTDPIKADTDGGTVNDGKEITNRTNPLDPKDDVPKKEEKKVEVEKAIVLDGIVFKTASAEISPEAEKILELAYNTLKQNPEIEVEIHGHTDNVGKYTYNMKLSQNRADAVKKYLVEKGIAESRIITKGFGPNKPIVPNTTPENRQKNRRIEFFRTK